MAFPIVGTALGIYLMTAPAVWGYVGTPAEMSQRICGPILAIFWLVSAWEVIRAVRWWTVPIALWLAVDPLFIAGPAAAKVSSTGTGIGSLLLCWLTHPGAVVRIYAGGWLALWRRDPYGVRDGSTGVRPASNPSA